ncbi:MAG: DEAD/DEAH box helicase [Termitinemataceae bacterium]|nr:MAG: DEAD/DEAH box helicase [Termitinemataceae bacterium]
MQIRTGYKLYIYKDYPARYIIKNMVGYTKNNFYWKLNRDGNYVNLEYCGTKEYKTPNFRLVTGLERELVREFVSDLNRNMSESSLDFFGSDGFLDRKKTQNILYNPSPHILELILSAGLLKNSEDQNITAIDDVYRPSLQITEKAEAEKFSSSLCCDFVLLGEDNSVVSGNFIAVAQNLLLKDSTLYKTDDLGFYWKEIDTLTTSVAKNDFNVFLSLSLSRFPMLNLQYKSYQTKKSRNIETTPALLFMEIDSYDYLHVRPVAHLQNFPPLFLENEDIITAVTVKDDEKTIYICEIIFPQDACELFRNLIYKNAKKESSKKDAESLVYEEIGRFIIEPVFAQKFFSENILMLSETFLLLETSVLAGYKVKFSMPKIKLSLGKGIDYLSGEATVEFENTSFSFADFMNEYRKNSFIQLADGTKSFPDKRTMNKLDRLLSHIKRPGKSESEADSNIEVSFFDIPLLLRDDSIEVSGAAWEGAKHFFTNYNTINDISCGLQVESSTLRSYQEYGVRWLEYLRQYKMGACLADEMGLGKTVQVIALLRSLKNSNITGTTLILCPKSVVYNWAAEFDKFAPDISYSVHYGQERNIADIIPKKNNSDVFKVVLSTYGTLRRDIEELLETEFLYVILDESQNIKNLTTQTTSAVLSLKSLNRLAMSGTPIENNLNDLYSLFRFLNPDFFGSQKYFLEKYLRPIQDSNDEEALSDLRTRIYPFILRRRKTDVLKDLPPKSEETSFINLDDKHLKIYHRKRLEYKSIIGGIIKKGGFGKSSILIFKALSELRRLATVPEADSTGADYEGPSAKRQYICDMIVELAENGHKCLVFANFLAGVELVSNDLAERGIANLTMTGATHDRMSLVRRFQTDPEIKAFIMTLKTGGTGLNLTAADYIFIMDPWWNSAAEAQAIDRSHRIGQTNPVFCYRLIARDTIEERILELQKRKTDLAGALLSDDAGALKTLSEDDISYLIGDDDE